MTISFSSQTSKVQNNQNYADIDSETEDSSQLSVLHKKRKPSRIPCGWESTNMYIKEIYKPEGGCLT